MSNTPLRRRNSELGYRYLRDRNSEISSQPESAKNSHRSLRPEIMVCVGWCTHDTVLLALFQEEILCPACGSHFDLAGRVYSGWPALKNLRVPPHRYIDDNTIEFIEAQLKFPT